MKDFSSIEVSIENSRSERKWDVVKLSLEEYSEIFDLIYDTDTKYHANLRDMKTYYWLVMAEYHFYSILDFHATMDCLRRAIAFNVSDVSVRCMAAKMLLHICQPTLQGFFSQDMKLRMNLERYKMKNFVHNNKLTLESILGECYKKVQRLFLLIFFLMIVLLFSFLAIRSFRWNSIR